MSSNRAKNVVNLITRVSSASCCPAHAHATRGPLRVLGLERPSLGRQMQMRQLSLENELPDYAFEMTCSNIRYGVGVTQEVGLDLANLKVKKVVVFTDKNLVQLGPMKATVESLTKNNINYVVYDSCRVEPTDESFLAAIKFAREQKVDSFLAVGGASVIDTAKAANLYSSDQEADFLDYVAVPVGKGRKIETPLKPLIAIPTTSGTGSETTGTSIFDYLAIETKTGISDRALKPLLGIVDPLHALSMPEKVACFSGFDVFCHALESFTALPYNTRFPRPPNPKFRPLYQGSNPMSDIWVRDTLVILKKFFKRSVFNQDDIEARSWMHMAATFAGIGFGNAGCHLCHGLSYPIAGNPKNNNPEGYNTDFPIVPHGLSVVITSPAVFEFTADACPEKHLEAAQLLGADVAKAKKEDAGKILADTCRKYMTDLKIPNGLSALGYTKSDIPSLVRGALTAGAAGVAVKCNFYDAPYCVGEQKESVSERGPPVDVASKNGLHDGRVGIFHTNSFLTGPAIKIWNNPTKLFPPFFLLCAGEIATHENWFG